MKHFLFALLFLSIGAHAQTYQGTLKGSRSACVLEVVQTYFDGAESAANLRADIVLKFSDGHHHLTGNWEELHFTVAPATSGTHLTGLGSNGRDQVNVMRSSASADLNNLTGYAVRWIHVNHFHSALCEGLRRVAN